MDRPRPETSQDDRSTFEKKGGYPSPKQPNSSLPKVPSGPAPGATPKGSAPKSE